MRTHITQCDLSQPLTPIWWPEDYWQVLLLVRYGRRPLGALYIGRQPRQVTLSRQQLEEEILKQLDISPWAKTIVDQLNILPSAQISNAVISQPTTDPYPPVSVVVCTHNRPLALRHCLASLKQLDYPKYEVIVVDNAPRDDETRKVVSATSFRYVQENRLGTSHGRNRGAAEAQHDIIAYLDDDVQVDPGWLHAVADGFFDSQVAALTGLVLPAELETQAQHLFEQYSGMSKGMVARLFKAENMQPQELIAVYNVGVGANMAFRQSTLETLGGFDIALGPGTPSKAGEDLDLFQRVLGAGLTLRYEPLALAWHQHRRDEEDLRYQLYTYGRGFGVYLINLWYHNRIKRKEVVRFALQQWFLGSLMGRLIESLRRKHTFPTKLIWAELWGALHAPWAYLATHRHSRKTQNSNDLQHVSLLEKVQV